ncbi:probable glutathione peroxidase 5 isoform X3 [Coffea arabica]|uniref:Glutathione peroxidase n=1 Tax=Coffea arabica TaxID=13443 RepID=A0ABM4VX39_COFAR
MGSAPSVPQTSIHEFTVKDSKGKDVDLSNYKGKVLLVVNVASKCGFTNSNYTQLTELYSKYKDKGFEILAFPCNQFLKQEPGTSEEAEQFACTRFKAEYPIFSKGYEGLLNYMGQIVLIDFAFVSFYNMDSTVQVINCFPLLLLVSSLRKDSGLRKKKEFELFLSFRPCNFLHNYDE